MVVWSRVVLSLGSLLFASLASLVAGNINSKFGLLRALRMCLCEEEDSEMHASNGPNGERNRD